jgi:5-methylcytosine-specific restriction endonuclease McrA
VTNVSDNMAKYMKARRTKNLAAAFDRLGGKCVVCGATEDLEFDHIDPSTKLANVCDSAAFGDQRFWAEVVKCQLLCPSCHQAKTAREQGWTTGHGRGRMYDNGCRCRECRDAKRDYMRVWRVKRRAQLAAA